MKEHSLKKQEKLTAGRDFREVFLKGFRIKSGIFQIRYLIKKSGLRRLGVSVSGKVANAVTRNRIKRTVREWFRLNKALLIESIDLVFIFQKEISGSEIKLINSKINQKLKELEILKYS